VNPPETPEFDVVSLGEVMMRLDPGERRIREARSFDVWIGGGEYNVAHAMAACFGRRAAVVTGLVDNEVGALVRNLVRHGGVDTGLIRWTPFDGVGAAARNGLNFTERGYGRRPAFGEYDRANSATAQLRPGDVDWADLFGRRGVRWLHTGGVFGSLSESTAAVLREAVLAAAHWGVKVSFDVNHRPSLWRDERRRAATREAMADVLPHVSLLLATHSDLAMLTGETVEGGPPTADGFRRMVDEYADRLPAVEVLASTLRVTHSAGRNDWGGIAWSPAEGHVETEPIRDLEILDRVGGGDGFAAGLLFGLLEGHPLRRGLDLAVAHGALVMSTPGDTSSVTLRDVERAAAGGRPVTVR
jgi:2-dehydro-3-deoxygluconokinase